MKNIVIYIIVSFLISACSFDLCQKSRFLRKYDSKSWMSDTSGCKGYRSTYYWSVYESCEKGFLKNKDTSLIKSYLGNPDFVVIYEDSTCIWAYYTEYGNHCIYPVNQRNPHLHVDDIFHSPVLGLYFKNGKLKSANYASP
jgi:hypothetical protein